MSEGWRKGYADVAAAIAALAPASSAVATWPLSTVRTFLLDPVNGNDGNVGYSDGAGPYNPAALAKKTIAGLKAVFPVSFSARSFRLIMAAGTYTVGLDQLINGATGIGSTSLIRGTATNATANTTAFSDDANDRIYQGWTTAPGMNGPGYKPTGVPTTTVIQCLTAGGGAPGFGAEPAIPLGMRIRFDGNAPTQAALRNVCRVIGQVSGTDTLTMDSALPAVPVATDVFYIEIGGLSFPGHAISPVATGLTPGLQICGITSTSSLTIATGDIALVGCRTTTVLSVTGPGRYSETSSFFDTTGGSAIQIGGCVRTDTAASYQRSTSLSLGSHVSVGVVTIAGIQSTPITTGGTFVLAGGFGPGDCGALGLFANSGGRIIGPGTQLANINLNGRWQFGSSPNPLTLTGAGAKPAIRISQGQFNYVQFVNAGVVGSTGNNDVGMDCAASRLGIFVLSMVPTVTGALGDVRVGGGLIVTWAQLAAGFIDANGNIFVGTTGATRNVGAFSGVLKNAGGAAVSTFAANYSAGQTANQATAQQYPVSVRLITKLRLCAPSGTPADSSLVATLYKNGVATTMTCTIAANQAAGSKASDTAHPILFADGDTYDVKVNGASASDIPFTAVLEGP